jgi:hypothetical protein
MKITFERAVILKQWKMTLCFDFAGPADIMDSEAVPGIHAINRITES